jgi:cytochrome P450
MNVPVMPAEVGRWSSYNASPAESLRIFEQARARCPVGHSDEFDGFYILLDYRNVRKALSDFRTFSSEPQVARPLLPRREFAALEMDPPRHAPWRALFSDAITSTTPEEVAPLVRSDVQRHLERIAPLGSCDIVRELCEKVPAETIFRIVGVDEDRMPRIRDAAIELFASFDDAGKAAAKQAAFSELIAHEIEERRRRPRADYLTRLMQTHIEGRLMTDEDLHTLMAGFLGAGHHSTTSAMTSLIHEVFSRPDVVEQLRREPALIANAIEETLRLRPSFFGFYRRAKADCELGGVTIPSGSDVYCAWAAANRDPDMFEHPSQFRLDRQNVRHLTFGFGRHSCVGANLARMEMHVVIEEMMRKLPGLIVDGPEPAYKFGGGDFNYIPNLMVRWPLTHML